MKAAGGNGRKGSRQKGNGLVIIGVADAEFQRCERNWAVGVEIIENTVTAEDFARDVS